MGNHQHFTTISRPRARLTPALLFRVKKKEMLNPLEVIDNVCYNKSKPQVLAQNTKTFQKGWYKTQNSGFNTGKVLCSGCWSAFCLGGKMLWAQG